MFQHTSSIVSSSLRNGLKRRYGSTTEKLRQLRVLVPGYHCREELRSFSAEVESKTREHYQSLENSPKAKSSTTADFLNQIRRKEYPSNLVCQRAEALFLQMLQRNVGPEDGREAVNLLDAAIENARLPGERLIPRLVALACQVMLQSGHSGSLLAMHRQLWRLLDNHEKYLTDDIEFNSHHLNDACAQFITGAVLESNKSRTKLSKHQQTQIQMLIMRLDELYRDDRVPLVANWISCNAFVMFHCNQDRLQEALELLQWMINASPSHPVDLTPRVNSFTATISAFAKVSPEKSLGVLDWMLKLHEDRLGPAPNSSCFNALLGAWAKSGRRDAGKRAEQILDWMQQLHDTKGLETAPDVVSWNSAINAWGHSPVVEAAEKAEALLRHMICRFEAGGSVEPENISFISVMNAWANSGRQESPDRVLRLLDLMRNMTQCSDSLSVDSYAYSVVLKAYENTDKRVSKHESNQYILQILGVLNQMYQEGIEVTPAIHNSIIMALCNFSVISAVLYFLEVEENYRMGRATINVRTFNSGLSAMALLNKQDASERATDILERMKEYSKTDPSVTPDQTTSNVMLKILSRSPSADSAARADDILAEMESQKGFESSQASYVTVIIGWGRSQNRDKFNRVKKLLGRYRAKVATRAISNATSPNIYNAIISVCRHNSDLSMVPQSTDLLYSTLALIREDKSVQPDETTYLTLFQALYCLVEDADKRDEVIEREIALCIKDGLVSKSMVEIIFQASPRLFKSVFGGKETPEEVEIPNAWSKRLRKGMNIVS